MLDLANLADAIVTGSLVSAFLLGLMGSSHCMGMCGGISAALGFQQQQKDWRLLSYNLGRIGTYTLIGLIAGLIGKEASLTLPLLGPVLRTLAGLLLIAMGLYLAGWWMGLTRLESIGQVLWQKIQPAAAKLLPINSHGQAFSLGALWGFLPCGLVYSTLSWALATADWRQSALLMLAFGLGTLPAMLVTGLAGNNALRFLRGQKARSVAATMMIALGLLTAITPWQHIGHANHGQHPMPQTESTNDGDAIPHHHHH